MKLGNYFAGQALSGLIGADQYSALFLPDKDSFEAAMKDIHRSAYEIADTVIDLGQPVESIEEMLDRCGEEAVD